MNPRPDSPHRPLWSEPGAAGQHDWLAPAPEPVRPHRPEPEGPPEPPRAPRRRRLRRALALAGALIAVGGAAFVGAELAEDDGAGAPVASLPAIQGRAGNTPTNKIYDAASKGVVSVRTRTGVSGSSGTGFVIDDDGTIVTNAHVVSDSQQVQVQIGDDDDPVPARVVGRDVSSDLAVLKVDPARTGTLHPLAFGDSDDVKVGDTAIAIGFPLGLEKTATQGIISGVGRSIEAPNGFSIDEVIQTDAPINPGNSGGPLLDSSGRVIGVNSQIATAGGGNGNVGIGFAVPSNTVREVVPRLAAGQSIRRPYLGVSTGPATEGDGAEVGTVSPGGPAAQGGLRVGDVIVSVAGKEVDAPDDVAASIAAREPGDRVPVVVRRNGREVNLDVRLGTRPERAP